MKIIDKKIIALYYLVMAKDITHDVETSLNILRKVDDMVEEIELDPEYNSEWSGVVDNILVINEKWNPDNFENRMLETFFNNIEAHTNYNTSISLK